MGTNSLAEGRYNVITKMLLAIVINPKIEITSGSEKGDGFVGEKSRVILQGDNKSMDLFVKGAPTDEAFKKAFDPRAIYLLEIMFYNDIYPIFNKFQTEKKIPKPFTSVIECVGTSSEEGNEILILQNARSLGYELWDKMQQLNKEHIEFVYTEYGKYHGISFAMKDQQPKIYESLVGTLPVVIMEFLEETMLTGVLQMLEKGKSLFNPEMEVEKYNRYLAFIDYIPEFAKVLLHHNDQFTVIVHGDSWSNNMMFKYDTKCNKLCPEKMCLLDFQLIGQASPVLDLSYFIYASAPKEIYDNVEYYLRVYYDSLSKTIRDLGSDPEVLLPFEELKNQWRTFSKYGFMVASIVLKICIQEKDETLEIAEAVEESEAADMMAGFTKEGKHENLYNQRFKSVIDHMIENDYI